MNAERIRQFLGRIPFEFWLFLTLWSLYAGLVNSGNLTEFNLQQMGVQAIVERGTFYVEGSPTPQLEPQGDVFLYNGHLYAAKQPGQFMLGAVVYFFLHWLGITYQENFLLASALVTWLTSGLVTALASVAVYRLAQALVAPGVSRWWSVGIALAFALGTTAFPYAGIAHHDAIASAFLVGAFYFVFTLARTLGASHHTQRAFAAGLLLGLTVTTSVLPFFMVLIVAVYFVSLRYWRVLPVFVSGGLVGILPLLVYDTINFGNPLLLPNFAGNFSDTFFHLDAENFVSKLGFYATFITLYVPLLWFGISGWALLPKQFRREQFVVLGLFAVLFFYILNIDTTGDCQFGPRYLLPVMPFAALGLVGFNYLAPTMRRVSVGVLFVAGLFSFVVNLAGASYGAMFCNLQLYAPLEYLGAVLGGRFLDYPLLWLAPVVVLSAVMLVVSFRRAEDVTSAESARLPLPSLPYPPPRYSPFSLEIIGVFILLAAAFLRFYRLWELPPGLAPDESFYGLDAVRVLNSGQLTPFFPQNGGREALFIYLQAVALAVWGVAPWVLRVVPVLVGIATIPPVYQLGRRLFGGDRRAQAVGLVAAGVLAVSYWHVTFSRMGLRAILLPLASTVVMYFFWRAVEGNRRRDRVWCGLALGVSLYTYLPARLLPVVLIVVLGGVVWFGGRGRLESLLQKAGIAVVAAVVVALPLGLYFAGHPNDFLSRTEAVALTAANGSAETGEASPLAIGENALRVAGMFFVRGDANPRHNLPGRPAVDVLTALGLVVGLGAGILRFRQQPAYLLLFAWLAAMLAPSVFSTEAPHFLRTIGALPPLVILAADGLTRVWRRVLPGVSYTGLALLVLVLSGALTYRDYFQRWANLPSLYEGVFDINAPYLAKQIRSSTPTANVLVPLRLFGRPALQFALSNSFPTSVSLAAGDERGEPLVVVTTQGTADKQWVLFQRTASGLDTFSFLDPISNLAQEEVGEPQAIPGFKNTRAGQLLSVRKRARNLLQPPSPAQTADVNFGNEIRLVGYTLNPAQVEPDQTVEVTLYWQALRDLDRDYMVSLQVVDPGGAIAGEWLSEPVFGYYTSGLWKQDTIVPDLIPLHIPADTPLGEYLLRVGWLNGPDRLPLVNAAEPSQDNSFEVGTLFITQ